MARASFRLVNRKGERVGTATFDGRSHKAARASGASYLRRLGIGAKRSNPKPPVVRRRQRRRKRK